MPLRRCSTSVTVEPSTETVTVSAWLGFTSSKASRPISVPSDRKISVNAPSGRPRSVKRPSAPMVVVMSGFSATTTVSTAADAPRTEAAPNVRADDRALEGHALVGRPVGIAAARDEPEREHGDDGDEPESFELHGWVPPCERTDQDRTRGGESQERRDHTRLPR